MGSHLLLLSRNLKASFTLIDDDKVEMKNVMSQFHTKMGVGKNKTMAAQQTLNALFGLKVLAMPSRLTRVNVKQLLCDADLVVDCLDNAASRQVIQDFVRENNIPCLHGALDADGTYGRVVWDDQFAIDHEGQVGAATCEDGRHLPFIVWASSMLATAVQLFVEKGTRVNFQGNPSGSVRF